MARKAMIEKEKRREKMVALKREKRQELKRRAADLSLSDQQRDEARVALNKMPRDSSQCRLRSRCQLTGRSRGVLKKFKLSRLCFREMALFGKIPGVIKASW